MMTLVRAGGLSDADVKRSLSRQFLFSAALLTVDDFRHLLDKCKRQLNLLPDPHLSDSANLIRYLESKTAEGWHHAKRMSSSNELIAVVWFTDASLQYFVRYFRVCSFDTTFCTNNKNMYLAPLCHPDQHGMTVVSFWVLLVDQSEESFTWLFRVIAEATHPLVPQVFFSDGDAAICPAVHSVCFVLFQVMLQLKSDICVTVTKRY
jgi:hypothetical protein